MPWRRKWQHTPIFLPGTSPGQRSLAGYSPWGHKVLNMTELLNSNNNILHIRGLKFSKTFISFWKSKDWYLAELALDEEDLTLESSRFLAGEKRQSNCHITVWEALKERFRTCVSPREGGPYSACEGFPEVVPFALGGGGGSVTCLVQLFATPGTTACQLFLSFTISWSLLKLMSMESMIASNHLIPHHPLLFLPSIFPSFRVFSNESALSIRWPKYWSFSISPSNEYSGLTSFRIDWFDLLSSKGLSRIFSNTTVQKHHFFSVQPCLWSNSHTQAWLLKKT